MPENSPDPENFQRLWRSLEELSLGVVYEYGTFHQDELRLFVSGIVEAQKGLIALRNASRKEKDPSRKIEPMPKKSNPGSDEARKQGHVYPHIDELEDAAEAASPPNEPLLSKISSLVRFLAHVWPGKKKPATK